MLDGDPAHPPPKKATTPNFRPMSIVAKQLYVSGYHFVAQVGLSIGDIVLDGDPDPPPLKGHTPIFGQCPLWPNGWMD